MNARITLLSNHEDLQVRVMQGVAHAIEDVSTELCMREGSVPSGAARYVFYEMVVRNILATIMKLVGKEKGLEVAVMLAKEAARAHERGESVPLERPSA